MKKYATAAAFLTFVATVIAANEALDQWGIVNIGFGLSAPAGVFFAGFAFGARDALHELGGRRWVAAAIAAGALLSWWVSDGVSIPGGYTSIAVASGLAFGLSETADALIYDPLRTRHPMLGVVASNTVGAVVDSALFLWLAFGSFDHIDGQVVGKSYMTLLALPIVWGVRRVVSSDSVRA